MNFSFKLIVPILMVACLFITGCWDERLLRDHSLVLSVGYDKSEEGKIQNTVTYPINTESGGGAQGGTPLKESRALTTTGNTAKDAEKHMDQTIPEKFDRSKARVVLFGKELAEEGFFSTLDSIYRDLRGPLNAKIAIFDGQAKDGLNIRTTQSPLTSDIYAELLDSAEKAGITNNFNVQEVCPIILQEGKDIILPFVKWEEKSKEAIVEGVALFVDDKMTGSLSVEETTVMLILMDKATKNLSLNLKIDDEHQDPNKNFVNIAVRKINRNLEVKEKNGKIQAKVDVVLRVEIDEYAADHLAKASRVHEVARKTEKRLNERAKTVIKKIQEANSDVLGIGSKVKAYHHDTWEKIKWKEVYSEIDIDVNTKIDIVRHGIMN